MSDLIAVAYPEESRAAEVRAMLAQLQHEHEYLADLEDAVVVTKDKDGKLKLHQSMNLASKGAVGGGIWGGLIGLIFLVPFVGAAVGAAAGALIGKFSDYGIDDGFVKELSAKMAPGSSALFVLVRKFTADRVIPEIAKFGGTLLQTSFSLEAEAQLQTALLQGTKDVEATDAEFRQFGA